MQKPPLSSHTAYGGSENLLIEALAPVEGAADQFQPIAFRGAQIACIHGISESVSAILLQNGIVVPVALAFRDLKQQIYEPDIKTGHRLDLTLVTGQAVTAAQTLRLSTQFNPAAEAPAAAADSTEKNLRILLFIEDRAGKRITLENLQERHIAYFEDHAANPKKTYLKLKSGCYTDAGGSDFYINLPLAEVQEKILAAKSAGLETLDLTQETKIVAPKSKSHPFWI